MQRQIRAHWILIFAAASMGGCNDDAKSNLKDLLKDCAVTDINSSKILYFGPSNGVGPGSAWRETLDGNQKHLDYRLRWALSDMPDPKSFVEPAPSDAGAKCKDGKTVSLDLGAALSFTSSLSPVNADVSNDFKKAKKVDLTIGSMGWDQVKEGPYTQYFRTNLGPANAIYEDMDGDHRLVLYRALHIKGLTFSFQFDASDVAALKAKYSGPLGKNVVGDAGANFTANWTNGNTMELSSGGDVWVLGELGAFKSSTGFSGTHDQNFNAVDIKNGPLSIERVAH